MRTLGSSGFLEEGEKNCRRDFDISVAIKIFANTLCGFFASLPPAEPRRAGRQISDLTSDQWLSFKVWLFVESIPDGSFNSYDFQLFLLVKSGSGLEILVCSYLSVKLHPSIRPILEKAFVPLVIENLRRGNWKGRVFFRTVLSGKQVTAEIGEGGHRTVELRKEEIPTLFIGPVAPNRQGIVDSYAKTMPQKGRQGRLYKYALPEYT